MNSRELTYAEPFRCTREELFELLITPSAIRQWWSASRAIIIPRTGGLWAATWGEDEDPPDFVTAARIQVFQPPSKLVLDRYQYVAKSGPLPFEAEFVTTFQVSAMEAETQLAVVQAGFPLAASADPFLQDCQVGWRNTFAGIQRFLAERHPA